MKSNPSEEKSGSPGTKILMAVVCLAVLTYFGIQLYRYFADPLVTALAYTYQVEVTISATGYLVRDEQVLTGDDKGLLQLECAEGARVAVGGTVAQIYADQASLDRQQQIRDLQDKLDQLEFAEDAASGDEVSLKLDSQIVENLLTMRQALAADRLDVAQSSVSELKTLVLKRDFTYTDKDDVKKQIEDLTAQLQSLQAQSATSVKTIQAPASGIYSAVVDGYESVLTPDSLENLTPSALSSLQPSGESSDLGKLILGDNWYFAAVLTSAQAKELTKGRSETLRFAKGVDIDLNVTVQSISDEEKDRAVVVFRGNTYLPQLTLLRRQSADIVRSTLTGIRIPKEAVKVNGEGQTGVYCVVGMVARFKPVTVIWSGDDFALAQANTDSDVTRLRAGDRVIIAAAGLEDGKVIN